jgi:hypothetical protein
VKAKGKTVKDERTAGMRFVDLTLKLDPRDGGSEIRRAYSK